MVKEKFSLCQNMNTIVKQKVIEQSVTHSEMMDGKLCPAVDLQNGLK